MKKKFKVKLLGGTQVIKFAEGPADAIKQADNDWPNQVVGIVDESPFNTPNMKDPYGKETKEDKKA